MAKLEKVSEWANKRRGFAPLIYMVKETSIANAIMPNFMCIH